MTSPKSYWSILKTFFNNKKIPCIPLLLRSDKFITNFKEKTEIFNHFFIKQCSLVNTNSDLPSVLSNKIHKLLSIIHFTSDDIMKIVKNLDLSKAHDHDMISIRMINICDASICKPLELIFRSCLEKMGNFQRNGKKLMWFQHTKKEIKLEKLLFNIFASCC